jgi:predicted ATPase
MRREVAFLGYYLQDLMIRSRPESSEVQEDPRTAALRTLGQAIRTSARSMQRTVFASAPVRIQPRRVYTPSELTSLNAGEQVPLEMANLKLSAPDRWQETKEKLNAFGRRSGLFEDIEVKRLGKTDSDPFQLQIKNQGPAANIVDVGYGVSQALPLLYPLQAENDYDFFLLQQPEVHLHPRAQAEFGSLLTNLSFENPTHNYVVETHSDFIVDRIRSDVRAGVIPANDVSILLFRRSGIDVTILTMGIDERGEITGYPEDYREFFLREQARVLGI